MNFLRNLFYRKAPVKPAPPPVEPTHDDKPGIYLGAIMEATNDEVTMIRDAVEIVRKVVGSVEFEGAVMSTYFSSTGSLSNGAILDKFLKSAIVVNVEMFYGNWRQNRIWKTVGLDIGDGVVYANRYFVQDKLTMASLILHEVAHQLGFHHESASEHTSVPYRMNEILERLAKELDLV